MSGDTRERILTVANELFTEQGYEGTSLREIAERLDITKAALYYHFRSKDEILTTLLNPFFVLLDDLLGRLEDAHDIEAWADALTWVVTKIFDYLDFFRLMGSNRHVVELLLESVQHDHTEMHARIGRHQADTSAVEPAAAEASQEALLVDCYAQLPADMREKLIDFARMLSELAAGQDK